MMLPWLARRAGVSDQRAEVLWQTACRQAALATGEQNSSPYWGVALQNLLDSLALERWRACSLLAWPWLLLRGSLQRWSALTQRSLVPLNAALSGWKIGGDGGLPGGPIAKTASSNAFSVAGPGAGSCWAAQARRQTASGKTR